MIIVDINLNLFVGNKKHEHVLRHCFTKKFTWIFTPRLNHGNGLS